MFRLLSPASRKCSLFIIVMICVLSGMIIVSSLPIGYASSISYPPYAKVGAQAFYSGNGGFFPFLGGVSGNISYYVSDVYASNDSMRIFVNENISLGTEAGLNTSTISTNLTDSIFAPRVYPAVPPVNLTQGKIIFENITCKFVENAEQTVPAGTFNATEFEGSSSNGTVDFWFDRSSGLAIEMIQAGSYLQLVTSNVAAPLQTQSQFAAELPFILVFVVGWAGAGALFYWVRRYYVKKSEREHKNDVITKTTKQPGKNRKKKAG